MLEVRGHTDLTDYTDFFLTKTKKTPLCDSWFMTEPLPSLLVLLLVSELPAISITNNGTLHRAAITQRKNQLPFEPKNR